MSHLCECGCGKETNIVTRSDTARGITKGGYRRFVVGHKKNQQGCNSPKWKGGRKIRKDGYVLLFMPTHPRSNASSYVLEHVVIAEEIFGRPLPYNAVVHHVDGNPSNNVPSNLVICENQAYHRFLHARMRAVKLGYPAVYKWCHCCSKYDSANNMAGKGERRYHQACMAKYDRERRKGAKDKKLSASGTVTQLAEQRLDNPFDEGSIPPSPVNFPKGEQTSREELP